MGELSTTYINEQNRIYAQSTEPIIQLQNGKVSHVHGVWRIYDRFDNQMSLFVAIVYVGSSELPLTIVATKNSKLYRKNISQSGLTK